MKGLFENWGSPDKLRFHFYQSMVYTLYISYFLVFFGIYYINPDYIRILSIFIQVFICGFLIWKFHPFKEHILHPNDGKLIFAAGFFLFTNVVATEIGEYVKNPLKYVLTQYVPTQYVPTQYVPTQSF